MAKKKRAKRATIRGLRHDLPILDSIEWVEPAALGDAGAGRDKEQATQEAKPKEPRRRRG